MGTVTRAQLRLAVAQALNMAQQGIATSSSSTTIWDATTPDRKREATDYWNGSTIYLASGTGGPSAELLDESAVVETETNGATVSVVSTVDPLDSACIAITQTATAGSAGKWSVPIASLTAGGEYLFSAWCKGTGKVSPQFGIYRTTATAADILAKQSAGVTSKGWTRVLRRVRLPAGCVALTVDLYGAAELSTTVYWDKPSFRRLGQERYISDWDNSTGTFTVAAWVTNPAVDTYYELYYKTFTLSDYDRAINDAIRRGWPRVWQLKEDTSIETVANTFAYDLPPSVILPIVKVEVENNTTYATAPYSEVVFWTVLENGTTRQLQFREAQMAGYTVRITYYAPVDTLETDFDELDDTLRPYVEAKAKANLYRIMLGKLSRADRVQAGENAMNFDEEAEFELRKVERQRHATRVRIAYPWAH
jgi:hypothetical protein